ncbi:hypothetical protein ALO_12711 [Acetonema longum DSM 6540]|uniref:Radical SAM domain protein n=2 Tax=Acetonema TaxID=2373 RepID=F7NKC9_9FIRM|nr:hypothetical protein ALO_12711 [Acetonema longum DSM 6540]
MCFFGPPELFIPAHDEVHVCCVFTWDREWCQELQYQWGGATDKPVKIGGPAFGDAGGDFVSGMYVRKGMTFTSRGCPNNCSFCFVPKREGKLRELPITEGNIIQDNNFLACSQEHRAKVYDMLKKQSRIEFKGGLEAVRLTDWDIEQMRSLKIDKLWFAADCDGSVPGIKKVAANLLKAGFRRDNLHCYVLIGDDMAKNEARLKSVAFAGMLPRAQLYQPKEWIEYSEEWKKFQRYWYRPAIYCSDLGLRSKFPVAKEHEGEWTKLIKSYSLDIWQKIQKSVTHKAEKP